MRHPHWKVNVHLKDSFESVGVRPPVVYDPELSQSLVDVSERVPLTKEAIRAQLSKSVSLMATDGVNTNENAHQRQPKYAPKAKQAYQQGYYQKHRSNSLNPMLPNGG